MQFEKHNHFAFFTLHFAFLMGSAFRNVRAASDRPYGACPLHFAFLMGGAFRNVRAANDRPYGVSQNRSPAGCKAARGANLLLITYYLLLITTCRSCPPAA